MEGEVGGVKRIKAGGWCVGENCAESRKGWVSGFFWRRIVKGGAKRWRSRWGLCWIAA